MYVCTKLTDSCCCVSGDRSGAGISAEAIQQTKCTIKLYAPLDHGQTVFYNDM